MFKKTIKYLFVPRRPSKKDLIIAFTQAAIVASFFGWVEWMLRKELANMEPHIPETED